MTREDPADRVALVTGASGGLGGEMANALLRAGYRVVLSGTRLESLKASVRTDADGRWACVAADLGAPDGAQHLADGAVAAFGRIDILVNNAGISTSAIDSGAPDRPVPFWQISDEMQRRFYQINTLSPLRLASLLVPAMIERGWGRIVNVTTGLGTMMTFAGYGGSKAGIEAETACMAKDLAGSGVTANVLLPGGPTATRMTQSFAVPASEMLQPDIVVGPTLYLASTASAGVTGRRFIAGLWDPSLPYGDAARGAGAPVAWTDLATKALSRRRHEDVA